MASDAAHRWTLTLGVLLASAFAVSLHAHGGQYAGPSLPGAEGARGATTAPPGPRQGGGATTMGNRLIFDSWEFWWQVNRDRFLRASVARPEQAEPSGGGGFDTGRGSTHCAETASAELRRRVDGEVVPVLLELLTSSDEPDVLASALLAAARCADDGRRAAVVERARGLMTHASSDVRSSAVLALGILGDAGGAGELVELVGVDSEHRAVTGDAAQDERLRAVGAVSLGLLGRPEGLRKLVALSEDLSDVQREFKWGVITGLGVLGSAHPLSAVAEVSLLEVLANSQCDDALRAAAAVGLGHLGAREAIPELVAALRHMRTADDLRRGAVLGLAQLADMGDERAVDALVDSLDREADRVTRHFALVALGEIAGRDALADQHPEQHARVRKTLLRELKGDGRSGSHRPWAAIAAALYARGRPEVLPAFVPAWRAGLRDLGDPPSRGAFLLAAGLAGDREALPRVRAAWDTDADFGSRGYAALALGLLGDATAAASLREAFADPQVQSSTRQRAAVALALLHDDEALDVIVGAVERADSFGAPEAAARALALRRPPAALAPLLESATRPEASASARAFACVALGLIGDRAALPWNEPLRAHAHYLIGFDTQVLLLSLF